jgi:hypothetical protein
VPAMARESTAKYLRRVDVRPVGQGRRVLAGRRCDVYLAGSDEPYRPHEDWKD